jgi:RNA polymerase subunit RPABC4/transcription elongation factor Spt4
MSLTTCNECGGKISTQARFCPHCGARPFMRWRLLLAVIAAGVAALLGVLLSLSAR